MGRRDTACTVRALKSLRKRGSEAVRLEIFVQGDILAPRYKDGAGDKGNKPLQ